MLHRGQGRLGSLQCSDEAWRLTPGHGTANMLQGMWHRQLGCTLRRGMKWVCVACQAQSMRLPQLERFAMARVDKR